jgi:hypothetical protein
MKADNQFQLIPEEMMPFNLAGETLPPPPQDEPLSDQPCVSATYLPFNYFTK